MKTKKFSYIASEIEFVSFNDCDVLNASTGADGMVSDTDWPDQTIDSEL